jgi:hypothetical protein
VTHKSLLFVGNVKHGKEADLRRKLNESNQPVQLLENSSLEGLSVYVGGGHFVIKFDYEGEDFTEVWNSFVRQSHVQRFAGEIAPFVEGNLSFGNNPLPGDLPLASLVASWPYQPEQGEIAGSPVMREKPGDEHLPKKEGIPSSQNAGERTE